MSFASCALFLSSVCSQLHSVILFYSPALSCAYLLHPITLQDPKTLVAANSASSSGEPRAVLNRLSSVSESTAANGGLSGDSQTSEGEDGPGRENIYY